MKPESPYEVGFGKPPKRNQFQKGQSGNPKGRPKHSLNLVAVLESALSEQVVITENGQRRTITKFEAMFKQVVNKAAGGDPRAFQQVSGLAIQILGPEPDESKDTPRSPEQERSLLAQFVHRIKQQASDEVMDGAMVDNPQVEESPDAS
jgi:hypothetical protein